MYTVNALVYLLKVSGNMSQLSSRAQQFSSLFTGFGSKTIVHVSLLAASNCHLFTRFQGSDVTHCMYFSLELHHFSESVSTCKNSYRYRNVRWICCLQNFMM